MVLGNKILTSVQNLFKWLAALASLKSGDSNESLDVYDEIMIESFDADDSNIADILKAGNAWPSEIVNAKSLIWKKEYTIFKKQCKEKMGLILWNLGSFLCWY